MPDFFIFVKDLALVLQTGCMRNFSKVLFFILFCFVLIQFIDRASGQIINFRQWSVEEGLAQSYVMDIEQDKDGDLWFSTADGISRFNGYEFIKYTKRDGLLQNYVTASCKDRQGNIWFGHKGGGVSVHYFDSDSFKIFAPQDTIVSMVMSIYEDSKGNMWFATLYNGVYWYDGRQITNITTSNGLSANLVFGICEDNDGNMWFSTNDGITVYDPAIGYTYFTVDDGLTSNSCRAIMKDSKGDIWVGTGNGGFFVIRIQNKNLKNKDAVKIIYVDQEIGENFKISESSIRSIYEQSNGDIWIGSTSWGIFICKLLDDSDKSIPIYKNYDNTKGLETSVPIYPFLEDREGNVWIGTIGTGVFQYSGETFKTYSTEVKNLLENSNIWTIFQDSKGTYWVGTDNGTLNYTFSNEEKLVVNTVLGAGVNSKFDIGISAAEVRTIIEDRDNNIWMGTWGGGINVYNPMTKKVKEYNDEHGLLTPHISSLAIDRTGQIYVGTQMGAYVFNKKLQRFKKLEAGDKKIRGKVNAIFVDTKDNIWFCTYGEGLVKYDHKSLTYYGESDGLKTKNIASATEDSKGNLWIATEEECIYKFDGKEFMNFNIQNGFKSDNVYLVICDEEDNIWVGTSNGVEKFSYYKKSAIEYYGKREGFIGIETNINAALKDRKGNLWFGTVEGFTKYDPAQDKVNTVEPLTRITGLQVHFGDPAMPTSKAFPYTDNHIIFNYVGVSLTIPEKVRYQYKLAGIDEDWSPINTRTYAIYPNLPHGNYVFQVRACNNDGIWNDEAVRFAFEIKPPFWKTTWFIFLCIILGIISIYLSYKWRVRQIEQEKKVLAEKVEERTHQLVKEKERVEEQKDIIEIKNKDITDSINYAKQIQDAILPAKEEVLKAFKDSFILYLPKDIVSGDFYWFAQMGDEIVIAAVDCTGHGVPGAFMSVIGSDSLNQVVRRNKIKKPSEILNNLHLEIRRALKQENSETGSRDGMDISLSTINLTKKTIQYAGAYNPLYHLRNGELNEIKADRYPIGGYQQEEKRAFTNHEIEIKEGDSIYLFSDGYVDQFGGQKGKKFKAKKFKKLILDNHHKKMSEQSTIFENNFISWRSELEQVDDVLVIGIGF